MRIWDVANFPALVRKREKEKTCPVIEDRKSGPVLNMCEKGSRTRGQEAKLQQRRRRRKEEDNCPSYSARERHVTSP